VARQRVNELIISSLDEATAPSPTLDQLASAANLSVNHFIRAFRQQNGITPHQYVVLRRLEREMAMLKKPGLSFADVAERFGFATPAHFVATFRRMMGAKPGAFRAAVMRQVSWRPPSACPRSFSGESIRPVPGSIGQASLSDLLQGDSGRAVASAPQPMSTFTARFQVSAPFLARPIIKRPSASSV
jgi:AraC-like DNA-binding protein